MVRHLRRPATSHQRLFRDGQRWNLSRANLASNRRRIPPGVWVLRPDVSDQVNDLLRFVVTEGTGRNADAQGYQVGGKTGTADIASGGVYAENRNSSFGRFSHG